MRHTAWVERRTTADVDVLDLTDEVRAVVADSGVRDGEALVFVPGSTGAITTIEYESGVVQDLKDAIDRMAPRDMAYAHDAAWHDGNGYSHVGAAMLGPALTVPVAEGHLILGTWQQIVLVDLDNKGRKRRILVRIAGEQ